MLLIEQIYEVACCKLNWWKGLDEDHIHLSKSSEYIRGGECPTPQ